MMDKEKSIKVLNEAIADELRALHQYMYFHFHCDDKGYDLLADLFKKTAIEEMQHVELLSERILFLGGDVEMVVGEKVEKEKEVTGMLNMAKGMEEKSYEMYNDFGRQCSDNNDSASRRLFEQLVDDEERHFDQYDLESDNLNKYGDNYLALQSIERSKTYSSGQHGGGGQEGGQ
ncbi:MAG: manganese catalase family protein [Bacteroidales bacterium]|nr:manganese catalase family protein [Bacteroidales bacterium]MCF8333121.1 manganese catalase family protein [Bacteroidales bacterium]